MPDPSTEPARDQPSQPSAEPKPASSGADVTLLAERREARTDDNPPSANPSSAPPSEAAAEQPTTRINDERFIKDLERLKDLRSFLIQEAVTVTSSDGADLEFGRLNLLRYNFGGIGGRDPTEAEWSQLERHTRVLFGFLSPPLRRRFLLGTIPGMLAWLPIILAPVALVALTLSIISGSSDILKFGSPGANVLPFYLLWLMSLGAIGAVAFIGMNALSVQEDITFDLTNQRLIILRIALGALFGLVLSLPIGFDQFRDFCQKIANGAPLASSIDGSSAGTVTFQAMILVLPFILGFSTSLVILILNRFVDAVQGFFGRRDNRDNGASATPPPPPLTAGPGQRATQAP